LKTKASNPVADGAAATGRPGPFAEPIGFDDAALVERTRGGDMQAYGLLVAKYQDRIVNLAYRMCGRREDAEELAQEAFLKALQKISQFRGHSRFYTWLFRIAANLVISHRRRSGRIRFSSLAAADGLEVTQAAGLRRAGQTPSPDGAAMQAERRLLVAQALEELDDEMKLVVILRDIEDMDYAHISEVLSVPAGTVKSRLHRARAALREKLAGVLA
jgi:RNA polymerase sigma-70 factor (ECF subfamily)